MPETVTAAWDRQKVERVERWRAIPYGPVVVGWECKRVCGCHYEIGLRLDRPTPGERYPFEMVTNFESCRAHHAEATRAAVRFREMPPSDEELHSCIERLYEEEISR